MAQPIATTEKAITEKKSLFYGITRNVFILGIISFLTDFSNELSYPLLPVFLTTILGTGAVFVGLIEGIAESTASILKLFSGWLSDKLNRRKALVICGYGLSSLTRPAIAISTMGWHILVTRFVDRIGKGIRTSPRDALIADSTNPDQRGKAFGFHRSMDHAGAVVGPLVAFVVITTMVLGGNIFISLFKNPTETLPLINELSSNISERNFRTIFWLASIPSIFALLVLIIFVKEVRRDEKTLQPPAFTLKPFDKYFKRFLPIIILFTLGNSSDAFLILRAKSLGVATVFVPILWVVLHIVKMLSTMPCGMWSDKVGRRKVIIIGWSVYGLIYLGFAFAKYEWHIWALFALYGIYFGLTEGTERAFVADLVPSDLRGTAYGVYNFAIGISALPASLLMGAIWDAFSPRTAFTFGAVIAIISMILIVVAIPSSISRKN